MKLHTPRAALLAAAAVFATSGAQAQEKFIFLTNWYAQAEHGGFYQALASGLYKKEGLDVTIKMGGPQVNGMQLLAAGQTDFFMGYDIQTMKGWEQGLESVSVAAALRMCISSPIVNAWAMRLARSTGPSRARTAPSAGATTSRIHASPASVSGPWPPKRS